MTYIEEFDIYLAELLIIEYSHISYKCKVLDECLSSLALSSAYYAYSSPIYDRIQDIMQSKADYINLKLMTDKCISKLSRHNQSLAWLMIKSPECSKKDIQIILSLTSRTLYRQLKQLYEEIVSIAKCCHLDKKLLYIINRHKHLKYNYDVLKTRKQHYAKESKYEDE